MSTTTDDRPEVGATIVAGGIATNYLEAGSGDPVVLIHGSGPGVTAYANWRLVLPALAEEFHVLHLSAHGTATVVELEDEDGAPDRLPPKMPYLRR